MDPVSAALGAGGLIGGYFQQKSADKQAKKVFNAQLDQFNQQQALAEKINKQGLAAQVDGNGNITYYDPNSNTWRTILSEVAQKIQDASNLEQLNQYSIDAPLAREQMLTNSRRQALEGGVADTLRRQVEMNLSGKTGYNPTDLAGSLAYNRQRAVNAGFEPVASAITTQSLRSGSNSGIALGNLAKARAKAMEGALGNPTIEGIQMADSINSGKLNNLTSNYNTYANRAMGNPASFNPTNIGAQASSGLAAARQGALQAQNASGNIMARAGAMPVAPQSGFDITSIFEGLNDMYQQSGYDPFKARNKTKSIPVADFFGGGA